MKAIHLKKFGLENLQLAEVKAREPGPGDVFLSTLPEQKGCAIPR